MRPNNRQNNELRPVSFTQNFTKHAEGSVLVAFGDTKVLCTASILEKQVPRFLKGKHSGWLTAEYSMLPRATNERTDRESVRGKQSGRTQEIQRLIGRSLRNCVDLKLLGENTIVIDCDVLQADGGTRTAAISGACVALYDAVQYMLNKKIIKKDPFKKFVAAVSVGINKNNEILDLEYEEDSSADTDMNVVMDEHGGFIEVQGTAEQEPMAKEQLHNLINLAEEGIKKIIELQKEACKN